MAIAGVTTTLSLAARASDGQTAPGGSDAAWVNHLGMRFAPVARLEGRLVSIWQTRVRDFRAFVADTDGNQGYDYRAGDEPHVFKPDGWRQRGWAFGWDRPGFRQTEDHPVTCVSWEDARAFCAWLTRTEQAAGRIGPHQQYRLPTDAEWSTAVGLRERRLSWWPFRAGDRSPDDLRPWGRTERPPAGWGNYAGQEARLDAPYWWDFIPGYDDGYPRTSPVGAFGPRHGALCDLGGNVWEWVEDGDDTGGLSHRLRGGAWSTDEPERLLSGARLPARPHTRRSDFGFRVVLAGRFPASDPARLEEGKPAGPGADDLPVAGEP